MQMLEVRGLSVQYGRKKIVDELSFSVDEGQWLMIVGPGKSTALAAVTQSAPYTGTVRFEGQDVARMKPAQRAQAIGVLAQNHFVGYGFTVEEVVRLGRFSYTAGLFGRGQREDQEKINAAIEVAGLTDRRRQSVLTLSGGELQRTFLAQVLAQDPKLLLLDEPSRSGLSEADLCAGRQVAANARPGRGERGTRSVAGQEIRHRGAADRPRPAGRARLRARGSVRGASGPRVRHGRRRVDARTLWPVDGKITLKIPVKAGISARRKRLFATLCPVF